MVRLSPEQNDAIKNMIENTGQKTKDVQLSPCNGFKHIGLDDSQEARLICNNKKVRTLVEGMRVRGDSMEEIMDLFKLTREQVTEAVKAYDTFYAEYEE